MTLMINNFALTNQTNKIGCRGEKELLVTQRLERRYTPPDPCLTLRHLALLQVGSGPAGKPLFIPPAPHVSSSPPSWPNDRSENSRRFVMIRRSDFSLCISHLGLKTDWPIFVILGSDAGKLLLTCS